MTTIITRVCGSVAAIAVIFAFSFTPTTALATGDAPVPDIGSFPGLSGLFDPSVFDGLIPGSDTGSTAGTYTFTTVECKINANLTEIVSGGSVTLNWTTKGINEITINGETVASPDGSKTYSNITVNTTYTLVGKTSSGSTCTAKVTIKCLPPPPVLPECTLVAAPTQVNSGGASTLTWTTTNADTVSISSLGTVALDGSQSTGPLTTNTSYTLTASGHGKTVHCDASVHVVSTPVPPSCPIAPAPGRTIVNFGTNVQLRSDVTNQHRSSVFTVAIPANLYDVRLVSWDGYNGRETMTQPNERYFVEFMNGNNVIASSQSISDLADFVIQDTNNEQVNTALTIAAATGVRAVHTVAGDNSSPNSLYPICMAIDEKPQTPAPRCDSFTAAPGTISVGGTATLNWQTTNATRVVINNGIGEVSATGTISVSPLANTTYTLTVFGVNDQSTTCTVPVTVSENKVPRCEAFTATPATVPFAGGTTTLSWSVVDATSISISPTVGTVAATGTRNVFVSTNTTFVLTAIDGNGDQVTCPAVVTREPAPSVFTCENNVTFSAANSSIRRGDSTTLVWNVVAADAVSISTINATAFSGSQVVTPNDTITYILTATKGTTTVSCPVPVTVTTGGGGGGSSSPRCELTVSDKTIKRGDEITLRWNTTRVTDLRITDDRGNVIVTTAGKTSSQKQDVLDGSIKLKPTRNTEYTLKGERGTRDVECSVKVTTDDIVILQTRDQLPLVAGISLSSVPYTGFEAGPFMTFMFYILLALWALYISYLIVLRKRAVAAPVAVTPNVSAMKQAETTRPDVFVNSVVTAPVAPVNLPTGTPVIGYENTISPRQASADTVTELENRAHNQKALLSSDAVRHFVATTEGSLERNEALDAVISEAKKSYPLEDGWVVINESRMRSLCTVCQVDTPADSVMPSFTATTVPQGTGSLAEAIVTGNVVAAYEMIGNRPMFALADAAADLDAIYRNRRGENKSVSDLLNRETALLSDEKIKAMIAALTSALDGTYTDEASAVKMAIMKAVKELS